MCDNMSDWVISAQVRDYKCVIESQGSINHGVSLVS